jgi:hypothetical protein
VLEMNPYNFGLAARLHVEGPLSLAFMGTTSNDPFRVRTNNVDRMFVGPAGNVGIGVVCPTPAPGCTAGAKLEVVGQVKITGGTPGAGEVLTSDVNGLATWETPAGGGINNVVEDTTPQLGGDLDGNGNDIDLSTGNLVLALNSSSHIQRSGTRFLHSSGGSGNTFLGPDAGNFTLTGGSNTGVGDRALTNNTGGAANTAVGHLALSLNTIGINNTAVGDQALRFNTVGSTNTAVGVEALEGNTTGVNNVGLGYRSGIVNTTGSNNIYLGANISAVNTESTTTRLGHQTTQTRTFIAGIRGKTTGVADAVTVMIDSAGQLGTVSSSLRYKFDVKDMGDVTAALMRLRPVTFRYKHVFAGGAQPCSTGSSPKRSPRSSPTWWSLTRTVCPRRCNTAR